MLSRHLILGLEFQVSFRPCWFRAQLRQLNGRPSIPSTLQLEAHQNIVWCRLHRLFTVLELLSIFKNGPWDFVLVPYLFKAPDFSFPVLEGIKQPRLLMVTKMFMNISEANFEQWCAHLQKLCASPSCLCFHGRVLSCFFLFFPFVSHRYVCHVFILFIVTALPVPGWKRCLSFFYCIILPFDLVMLNRMSYNVESAKSVLFSKVCNLLWNVKDFLCNTHITKTTKMLYMVSRCHC